MVSMALVAAAAEHPLREAPRFSQPPEAVVVEGRACRGREETEDQPGSWRSTSVEVVAPEESMAAEEEVFSATRPSAVVTSALQAEGATAVQTAQEAAAADSVARVRSAVEVVVPRDTAPAVARATEHLMSRRAATDCCESCITDENAKGRFPGSTALR